MTRFDSYAHDYDSVLNEALAISGDDNRFFAKGRIVWLSECLDKMGVKPRTVMDYGCGTGTATPLFIETLGAQSVLGVDVSTGSLDVARHAHQGLPAHYMPIATYEPREAIDLVFCNGVFHHVPLGERRAVVEYIAECLRPKGIFALWENNPWNPGTRYVMGKIPFDKDAVMLSARQARSLVESVGFRVLRTDYCFVFPRILRAFRRFEESVRWLPIGAQYQLLCQKVPTT